MKNLFDVVTAIEEPSPYLTYLGKGSNTYNIEYQNAMNSLGISCRCGHSYHRHFDGMESSDAWVSCKYCCCSLFTGLMSRKESTDDTGYWHMFVQGVRYFYSRPAHVVLKDSLLSSYRDAFNHLRNVWKSDPGNTGLDEFLGLYEILWPVDLTVERIEQIHKMYGYDPSTYVETHFDPDDF